MEIISYLDNRQTSYSPKFKPVKIKRNFQQTQDYSVYAPVSFNGKKGIAIPIETALNQWKNLLETAIWYITKRFWLILSLGIMIVAGVALAIGIVSLGNYIQSFPKPVELAFLTTREAEFLNGAMEKFALYEIDDVDSYGNLLENGSTISISDVNLREPVKFTTYIVKTGDTISQISRKFGLTNISTLIGVNNIGNVRQLRAGQKLIVPSVDGLNYTVESNDTLEGLSVRYNVAVEDILDVNDLSSDTLVQGQQLFIPGAKLDSSTLKKAMGELFIYPLSGNWRLTSRFGKRADPFTGVDSSHTGIDMAMSQGSPIKAAMSGKIIGIGYTNVYGNYVIIDHENGYQTLYAHMQKPCTLKKGQYVNQGAQIGLVGNTGYSTGPHLHFTVYKNGKLIDPLTVLK
ncbi:MAG: M23 family metallopeptidase [Spirochaetaceae bacterium]|nr:M23 family metallopeptidase [Spirochaetaceae bacterium]